MAKREATKQEAEEAAHVLSHQAWMPTCTHWIVIERTDGTVYVRGHMDPDVPDEIGRARLDALPHYLSGRMMAETIGHPRAWYGRYGRVQVMVSMPDRPDTTRVSRERRTRVEPPAPDPCPAVDLADRVRSWAMSADLSQADAAALERVLDQAVERTAAV